MKKTGLILGIILLAVCLGDPSWSFDRGRGRGGYPGRELDVTAIPGMELTDAQTAELRTLYRTHLSDVEPLRARMMTKRHELMALWLETAPDRSKIAAVESDITKIRDQLHERRIAYGQAVLKILTTEQRDRLRAAWPEPGSHPGHRWGRQYRGGYR